MAWETVIGLEVHARLLTESKMFCGCSTAFGAPPNTHVCPVCLAYPGALPVMNRRAVELAMRMALASGCEIQLRSQFARKNYFYPDLPKGYQISQFERPLAIGGTIVIGEKAIRLRRIHLEEDAGKLIHEGRRSLVDLNRSGTPLIEIVSEPDIGSAADAATYFNRLRQMLMYTEVCDGNMEEGSLRCDANVSLHLRGSPHGTRVEIKNLNSFRFMSRAIEFEIERQTNVLEGGGKVVQETRLFDPIKNETRPMRTKEEAHDYRYFPEPDLFALEVDRAWIEKVRTTIPKLPGDRSARYQRDFGLTSVDAEILVTSREIADYFEEAARLSGNAKAASNWIRNEVLRVGRDTITPSMLAKLIQMIDRGAIGGKAAKEIFDDMSSSGEEPERIAERKGLAQVSDAGIIREAAQRVIARNGAQVEQYRGGKAQVFGFLVGQLMKEMRGKANAEIANSVLRELLNE
ncbi:MAG TPA: Asp-tRNA(Asn)/Glu-tRNA(Gln) amidotransferase subunit GatB [Thermoanaerobaculia bacterium]|jgi:aspartyl-tRNA(Asn)/glutamyl-tRNA(Gln) amidotransferase subunit B|nr:Asp-tRNA(Asn)/Glu-tRNA(Gln) amidotransferase subunit GatB [Thermoanaerobaculia bacterium]